MKDSIKEYLYGVLLLIILYCQDFKTWIRKRYESI